MARPLRLQVLDGIYHLTARGNERSRIFRDDADRRHFLELVDHLRERYHWRIFSYCLMSNHYHLLAQTPEPNLARGMRQLNGVYAQAFNRRHARVGHLWQGRYSARLVQADEHLLATARYIVRNPVRAGLCRHPDEWRWSSHRATLGLEPPWFLEIGAFLAHYAPLREVAREQYRTHTEQPEGERSAHPLVDGDESFIAAALKHVRPASGIPRRYLQAPRPDLPTLLETSNAEAAIANAHEHGYSLRQIARHLGVNASTVSRRMKRQRARAWTATNGT